MNSFYMGVYLWQIEYLEPYSDLLVDRSGVIRVATTDPVTHTIFLSRELKNNDFLLETVLLHELGHAAMISYNIFDDLHRMVKPRYWVDIEEWVCNFLADYGSEVFDIARDVLGKDI